MKFDTKIGWLEIGSFISAIALVLLMMATWLGLAGKDATIAYLSAEVVVLREDKSNLQTMLYGNDFNKVIEAMERAEEAKGLGGDLHESN